MVHLREVQHLNTEAPKHLNIRNLYWIFFHRSNIEFKGLHKLIRILIFRPPHTRGNSLANGMARQFPQLFPFVRNHERLSGKYLSCLIFLATKGRLWIGLSLINELANEIGFLADLISNFGLRFKMADEDRQSEKMALTALLVILLVRKICRRRSRR